MSGRLVVDVVAALKRRDQRLVARQVGQHPQFDLRVVGRDQHVAGFGDEGAADLAAEVGADRDVLQIGVAARQSSGGGDRLVEGRVHAAGLRVHQLRQRVDVGALQLLQAAPVEDESRQVVCGRQFLEHLHGRRDRARLAGALQRRQFQLLEQDLAELLGRVDVELDAGQIEDLPAQRGQLAFEMGRLRGQHGFVDPDAGLLDADQHANQRPLERLPHACQILGVERAGRSCASCNGRSARSHAKSHTASAGRSARAVALTPLPVSESSVTAL